MINSVRVDEDSKDASVRSKAPAKSALAGAGAPTWNIECGDQAIRIPQEPVNRGGCVEVEPRDVSTWSDREALRPLADSCARARRIECGDDAILVPQETVPRTGRINVVSCDGSFRIDQVGAVKWKGALAGPRARARRIENGNHALIGANVAVGHIA